MPPAPYYNDAPFWNFVASLEEQSRSHPWFANRGGPAEGGNNQGPNPWIDGWAGFPFGPMQHRGRHGRPHQRGGPPRPAADVKTPEATDDEGAAGPSDVPEATQLDFGNEKTGKGPGARRGGRFGGRGQGVGARGGRGLGVARGLPQSDSENEQSGEGIGPRRGGRFGGRGRGADAGPGRGGRGLGAARQAMQSDSETEKVGNGFGARRGGGFAGRGRGAGAGRGCRRHGLNAANAAPQSDSETEKVGKGPGAHRGGRCGGRGGRGPGATRDAPQSGFENEKKSGKGPGACRGHGGLGAARGGFGPRGGPGAARKAGGPQGAFPFRFGPRAGMPKNQARANNVNKDFTPAADIFDTPESYVVHVSLPGAKKEDVGVNWDSDKSVLSIAGVSYRPGDEELLKTLALDGRKVGAFERKVRLGSKANPAQVDVYAISARMEDGVLRIDVPKLGSDEYIEIKKVDIE